MSLNRFNGRPIYPLASKVGLVEWTDYLPVKQESAGRQDTTDATGYFKASSVLADITGLVKWMDYIPVYVEAGRSKPWSTDSTGYIPFYAVA